MSDLTPEAKVLRERISRYPTHTQEELNQILGIEFEFVQLLDLILRLYPLDAQTHKAIAYLEESRNWVALSVKRGQQESYERSNSSFSINSLKVENETIESGFEVVLNIILSRCVPNREMDLAIARLNQAKTALREHVSQSKQHSSRLG